MLKDIILEVKITSKKLEKEVEKIQTQIEKFEKMIMDFQETDEYFSDEMKVINQKFLKMFKPLDNFSKSLESIRSEFKKSRY